MIKDIAFTICGQSLCGEPCEGCTKDDGNCTHILTAKCVYTSYVKPLEDALNKLEVDFWHTSITPQMGYSQSHMTWKC